MTSAYPVTLDKLTEQVKTMAIELGQLPSRNRIKRECKVGADKANAVLAALEADGFKPTPPDTTEDQTPARHLHSVTETDQETTSVVVADEVPASPPVAEVTAVVDPVPSPVTTLAEDQPAAAAVPARRPVKRVRSWPLLVIALGAFVAIWGGWVELGKLTGFGEITPLPGIADDWTLNSAITLPLGMEAYAAFALNVWLSNRTRSAKARGFAKWSALGALVLGAAGQVAYHLMKAAGLTVAPWQITAAVSCLPVIVLGFGAALVHLIHNDEDEEVCS